VVRTIITGKEALLRRSAQTVRLNAKSLLSQPETVQYTARSVFLSVKKAADHLKPNLSIIPGRDISPKTVILISRRLEKTAGLAEKRSQVFAAVKDAINDIISRTAQAQET